jgi:hypothetical protein
MLADLLVEREHRHRDPVQRRFVLCDAVLGIEVERREPAARVGHAPGQRRFSPGQRRRGKQDDGNQ